MSVNEVTVRVQLRPPRARVRAKIENEYETKEKKRVWKEKKDVHRRERGARGRAAPRASASARGMLLHKKDANSLLDLLSLRARQRNAHIIYRDT